MWGFLSNALTAQAGRLLDEALSSAAASDDVTSLIHARNNLLLLAKVHKGTGNHAEGADVLLRALELQVMCTPLCASITCCASHSNIHSHRTRSSQSCELPIRVCGRALVCLLGWFLHRVPPLLSYPDLLQEQREEAASLCHTLAQAHLDMLPPDEEKARIYFSEAIKVRALRPYPPCVLL